MQIPRDIIDEVRNRTSLAEVIGKHVTLTKMGTSLKGLCPFHGEKTPSFNVQENKGVWHCFGCGEGGDVFKFLMKIENRGFMEVVEDLAERVGVVIPKAPPSPAEQRARSEADEMFLANEKAKAFFINTLHSPDGKSAREYLKKRAIGDALIEEYALGFCGPGWDALARWWNAQKLFVPNGIKSGLFIKKENRSAPYDRFHDRLTFTITNPRGRVIGFGGRKLEGETTRGDQSPKYLNSAESPVYHKSDALYGLDAARGAIGKTDRVIVVEGYFDVLGMAQAGIREVVASCGTALTPGHLQILRRLTKNVILLYDGDDAGRNAAKKSVPLFFEAGMTARYCPLPDGDDPDTWAQKMGIETVKKSLGDAIPVAEFFIDEMKKFAVEKKMSAAERAALLKRIAPVFSRVSDPIELGEYAHQIADGLSLKEDAVLGELTGRPTQSEKPAENPTSARPDFRRAGGPARRPFRRPGEPEPVIGPMPTADIPMSAKRQISARDDNNSEELVLRLMLGSRKIADSVRARNVPRLFKDLELASLGERLAEAVLRVRTRGPAAPDSDATETDQPDIGAVLDAIPDLSDAEYRLITRLSAESATDSQTAPIDFEAVVLRLEQRRLGDRIRELRVEIAAAARSRDVEREKTLTAELSDAVRRVKR